MKKLSIVVPVYNEQDKIEEFVIKLKEALPKLPLPAECIIIDDKSDDSTRAILGRCDIKFYSHSTNLGYGAAIKTGIRKAQGDAICIIDGDNTYAPEDITRLVPYAGECDMVVGARVGAAGRCFPFHQKLGKALVCSALKWGFGREVPDVNSGLRIMRKEAIERYLAVLSDRFSFTASSTLAMLLDGRRIKYVPIGYLGRRNGSKVKAASYTVGFIKSYCRVLYNMRVKRAERAC